MSTFSRQRKSRLRRFEERALRSRDLKIYREWRYVTVHPFADEPELLERLGIAAESCKMADVWWHTGKDIVLLQTRADSRTPGRISASWFGDSEYLSIIADFGSPTVTINELHSVMDQIVDIGLPRRPGHSKVRLLSSGKQQ